jgi:hypothetical protein
MCQIELIGPALLRQACRQKVLLILFTTLKIRETSVTLRQDWRTLWPSYAKARIVPSDAAGGSGPIRLRELIEYLGVIFECLKTVGKAFRNVEHGPELARAELRIADAHQVIRRGLPRLVDEDGDVVPYRPGVTWFEVLDPDSRTSFADELYYARIRVPGVPTTPVAP